ncbi:conserved hypothetical protein [Theileria equi strain WA]|uniref:Uncharacterized protein n=1 Tax=Theileria equi strain WA TaxID=1537102 RepID=L1LG47_THEEQ|nr:conserved hypothetical protein [Theileria equi strain WA]EKX74235.1 conserved hypothetical protein [Theileria equi strain WA]|eukprot:XP_004833687.1 conserved hypothetical protein [Theileria equi strain WA]
MLDELPCLWNRLFGESTKYSSGYNRKLLNRAIEIERLNLQINKDLQHNSFEPEHYSFKRILGLILDSNDPELVENALDALLRLREELIVRYSPTSSNINIQGTFKDVSDEYGFEQMLENSIKMIIVDHFNRKIKDTHQEFIAQPDEVSNVAIINEFIGVISELKSLVKNIKSAIANIEKTNRRAEEVERRQNVVEECLKFLEDYDSDE